MLSFAPLAGGRDGDPWPAESLRLTSRHFIRYESELMSSFLPQAGGPMHAERTESLETKMLAAERKHAIADVARGVSHDLNNAVGAVLPLVEQMRADADSGTLDPKTFGDDLKQIEHSLQVCRRIFSGMLTFRTARREHRPRPSTAGDRLHAGDSRRQPSSPGRRDRY